MRSSFEQHRFTLILFFLLLLFGVSQHLVRNAGEALRPPGVEMKGQEYAGLDVNPQILKRLLGLKLMASDLIWIDTLIKSDTKKEEKDFTSFYFASRTITQLNPDNFFAYYILGLYLSVIKDDVKAATVLMRDGAKHLQDRMQESSAHSEYFKEIAWRLYFTLGFNLLFEENEFDEGSYWLQQAAAIPHAPQYLKALAERLSTEIGQLEVASRILNDLYLRATKPEEKKRIEEKLLEISERQELVEINERFTQYLYSTGAYSLDKDKAFALFVRSSHQPTHDIRGRKYVINKLGKIVIDNAKGASSRPSPSRKSAK